LQFLQRSSECFKRKSGISGKSKPGRPWYFILCFLEFLLLLAEIIRKATGKYQINDTHLHFPMKTTIQVAAKQWRMSLIRAYRQTRDMEIRGGQSVGKATEAFQDKCNAHGESHSKKQGLRVALACY